MSLRARNTPHRWSRIAIVAAAVGTAWCVSGAPATAQVRVNTGPAPATFTSGVYEPGRDDITPEEHQAMQAQIDANVRMLRERGALPQARATNVLFAWPLAAAPGVNPFGYHGISGFVDQDIVGNGFLDYNCLFRTYNTHKGTDIFLWPFPWNKVHSEDVHVVAAAAGTIVAKVDGNLHNNCTMGSFQANRIFVEHVDGSIAWYLHMKKGSLTKKGVGDSVATGEYLGVVASSGSSTGPHLHFEVRSATGLVDPWAGPCNSLNPNSWWAVQRPYWDSGLNAITTGTAPPVFNACPNEDTPNARTFFLPGSVIYFTSYYHDQLSSQTAQHTIYRPDDSVYASWSYTLPFDYPASYQYFSYGPFTITGKWRYEIVFDGTTYTHELQIVPASTCPPAPVAGCDIPKKSTIALEDKADVKDTFSWSFKEGRVPMRQADFGNPTSATEFLVCLYDASGGGGSDTLKLQAVAPAGALWSATGEKGFKYKEKTGANDGLQSIILKGGKPADAKRPQITVKGKGVGLDDPLPPALTLPVRAQMLNSDGRCWEAAYATAKKNDGARFKTKTP